MALSEPLELLGRDNPHAHIVEDVLHALNVTTRSYSAPRAGHQAPGVQRHE
jgi:hypothetical protein